MNAFIPIEGIQLDLRVSPFVLPGLPLQKWLKPGLLRILFASEREKETWTEGLRRLCASQRCPKVKKGRGQRRNRRNRR